MDLGKMAAKPVTLNIDGKKYAVSPITIGDLADFEQTVKSARLKTFLDVAKAVEMDVEEKAGQVSRILNTPFTNEDFQAELATMSGVRFMAFQSLKKAHPKITLEVVSSFVNLDEVMEVINAISGIGRMSEADPSAATPEPPQPGGQPSPDSAPSTE